MAYEQAIELFGDALRVLDLAGAEAGRRARSCWRWARPRCAPAAWTRVAGRFASPPTPPAARETWSCSPTPALASAPWGLATALADEEGLIPLLEEALERLPEADGALRARLLARLAAALYW